jgi:predicted Zn-dependent protease
VPSHLPEQSPRLFTPPDIRHCRIMEQEALRLKAAGRFEEAAALFAQLIKQNPKNHVHHYNLGNTHLAANRPADAIDPIRRAIRLAPNQPAILRRTARKST